MLEPARMGGELAGLLDPMLQGLVLHSSIATAAALRIAGLALIIAGLRSAGSAQIACGVTLAIFRHVETGMLSKRSLHIAQVIAY